MKFGIEIEFIGSLNPVLDALRSRRIEVEYEGHHHNTRSNWKIVSDASVHGGWELVSPILDTKSGAFKDIQKVCAALNEAGASVNRSCGFHVHVDARGAELGTIKNIVKFFYKFEPQFDKVVSDSRRNNRFCQSNRVYFRDTNDCFNQVDQCRTIYELRGLFRWNRYHKLNLESLERHGTVEFRQHQGTIDADKMIAWVKLCVGVVETASKYVRPSKKDYGFGGLMDCVSPSVRQFFVGRAAHFGFAV